MKYLTYIQELQRNFASWHGFPDRIKYHPDVFISAFMMNGRIFKDAPSKIKENDKLVAKVLKVNGYNLEHCLERHRMDASMVQLALLSTPMVAKIVDPVFLNNEDILLRLAKKSGHVFAVRRDCFDDKWFGHQEIMHSAIENSPLVFQIASTKYRSNYQNCLHACIKFAGNYQFVEAKIKEKHTDLAELVFRANSKLIKHIPENIKNSPDFILKQQLMERG